MSMLFVFFAMSTAALCLTTNDLREAQKERGSDLLPSVNARVGLRSATRFYQLVAGVRGAYCTSWRKCKPELICDVTTGQKMYGLGVCKQTAPPGQPCGRNNFICKKPWQCVPGFGGSLCRHVQPLGGMCADRHGTSCAYGLECYKTRCIHRVGYAARCDVKHQYCRKGFACSGNICKVLVRNGGYCGYVNSVCHRGYTCNGPKPSSRSCVKLIGKNQVCGEQHSRCLYGMKCLQVGKVRRCCPPLRKGQVCGTQGRYCGKGLRCYPWSTRQSRCVGYMQLNQPCNGHFMVCVKGSRCSGPIGRKKCLVPKAQGDICSIGRFSYSVCAAGKRCMTIKGQSRCYLIVPELGSCNASFTACDGGLLCAGLSGKKQCRSAVSKGAACSSPYDICSKGLSCVGVGKAARCSQMLGLNGNCTGKFMACKPGFECRGPRTKRLCLRSLPIGGVCDKIYRFCGQGLRCRSVAGTGKRCVKEAKLLEDCTDRFTLCDVKLQCVPGQKGKRNCQKPVAKGGKCSKNTICGPNTLCNGGVCVSERKINASCSNKFQTCSSGLVCARHVAESRCVRPLRRGGSCNAPFSVCQSGLTCFGKRGSRRCSGLMGLNAKCEGGHMYCKSGLACLGPNGRKRCRAFSAQGAMCGIDYHYCSRGLLCLKKGSKRGICVRVLQAGSRCNGESANNTICNHGLSCVGDKVRICRAPVKLGNVCGGNAGLCEEGFFCHVSDRTKTNGNGVCFKVLRRGFLCEGRHVKCGEGLHCSGIPGSMECVQPMGKGKRCDDPYWVCKLGLICRLKEGQQFKRCS